MAWPCKEFAGCHSFYRQLLSIFVPGQDGTGRVELTLAGDSVITLEGDALEALLRDVMRPDVARFVTAPFHPN